MVNGHSKITDQGDFIEKKIYVSNCHVLRDNWLEKYQNFSDTNPYLVDVLSVAPLIEDGAPEGSAVIRMEKIDVVSRLEDALSLSAHLAPTIFRPKLIHETLMVLNKCMVQTLSNQCSGSYFFNSDFRLSNIVVTPEYNLRVIDPDSYFESYNFHNYEKLAMTHTQMLGVIRKYL